MTKQKIIIWFQRLYVNIMMAIVGRALAGASRVDDEVQKEVQGFQPGYTIEMMTMSKDGGPRFRIQVNDDHTFALATGSEKPNLSIKFKHISHAFLVFSFQEGTAKAFSNDRMIVDGDLSDAIRVVRCMNRMESIILPKLVAQLAVKRYSDISFFDKISKALRIYGSVAKQFVTGS